MTAASAAPIVRLDCENNETCPRCRSIATEIVDTANAASLYCFCCGLVWA